MKKIIVALFAASSLLGGVSLPAMAAVDVAAVCDGAVPDGWKRPGGFCDQNQTNSISSTSDAYECPLVSSIDLDDVRMLAAGYDPCYVYDCTSITEELMLDVMPRDRIVMTAC
jgi:hypothetical protein